MKKPTLTVSILICFILYGCFDPYFTNFGTCFLPGTVISTPDGPVAIETLKHGQSVYSYNEKTEAVVVGSVDRVYVRKANKYLELSLSSGKVLQVTGDHPIAIRDQAGNLSYVTAEKLALNDQLVTLESDTTLSQSELLSIERREEEVTVYNFKVHGYRNGFAEGILSHFYFQPGDPLHPDRQIRETIR